MDISKSKFERAIIKNEFINLRYCRVPEIVDEKTFLSWEWNELKSWVFLNECGIHIYYYQKEECLPLMIFLISWFDIVHEGLSMQWEMMALYELHEQSGLIRPL